MLSCDAAARQNVIVLVPLRTCAYYNELNELTRRLSLTLLPHVVYRPCIWKRIDFEKLTPKHLLNTVWSHCAYLEDHIVCLVGPESNWLCMRTLERRLDQREKNVLHERMSRLLNGFKMKIQLESILVFQQCFSEENIVTVGLERTGKSLPNDNIYHKLKLSRWSLNGMHNTSSLSTSSQNGVHLITLFLS